MGCRQEWYHWGIHFSNYLTTPCPNQDAAGRVLLFPWLRRGEKVKKHLPPHEPDKSIEKEKERQREGYGETRSGVFYDMGACCSAAFKMLLTRSRWEEETQMKLCGQEPLWDNLTSLTHTRFNLYTSEGLRNLIVVVLALSPKRTLRWPWSVIDIVFKSLTHSLLLASSIGEIWESSDIKTNKSTDASNTSGQTVETCSSDPAHTLKVCCWGPKGSAGPRWSCLNERC